MDPGRAVEAFCKASDPIWHYCRTSGPWTARAVLRACELTGLLPPPPASASRRARCVLVAGLMTGLALLNLVAMLTTMMSVDDSLMSTLASSAMTGSAVMAAVKPVVVLLSNAWHFRAQAPAVATLCMPPTRTHGGSAALAALLLATELSKQAVIFFFVDSTTKTFVQTVVALPVLVFDVQLMYLGHFATDKLKDLNERLSDVDRVVPELRALTLESAARQFELVAEQVSTLGGMGAMGAILAMNNVEHRVKMVTEAYMLYLTLINSSAWTTLAVSSLGLCQALLSVVGTSWVGDGLYREVERVLRNSRYGILWSMGGLSNLTCEFMLSVIGSTVTYMVVLMQYKDHASPPDANSTVTSSMDVKVTFEK